MMKERSIRQLLVFGCIALAALLSSRFHVRFDLSRNGSYTPSPYSREVLGHLDSPVTVTWYRSALLRQYSPAVRYIEDFMDEFRKAADGNFAFRILDPTASGKTELMASLGIASRRIELPDGDGTTGKELWSGLVVEYRGEYRIIPFFLDTATLDYDLVRLVLELRDAAGTAKGSNALQIVFGNGPVHPAAGPETYRYIPPWLTYAGYTQKVLSLPVVTLDPEKSLLVIGSSSIDDTTAGAIEAFLSDGGNAAFFVSGSTVDIDGTWKAVPKSGDRLLSLLEAHGFTIETPLIMDITNFRISMPALDNSKIEYINYPFWVTASGGSLKKPHPLLSGVRRLLFYWPSQIVVHPGSGMYSLVETSPAAILMNAPYDTDPFGRQLSMFSSAKKGEPRTLVAASTRQGRMLLVADEYFPSAMIEYTDSDANLDFLVSCIEWISGKDGLLELKNRMPEPLPFPDTGSESGRKRFATARIMNTAVIPALVLLAGATALYYKRKRR